MTTDERALSFAQFVKKRGFELADWQLDLAGKILDEVEVVLDWESNGARTTAALVEQWKELA